MIEVGVFPRDNIAQLQSICKMFDLHYRLFHRNDTYSAQNTDPPYSLFNCKSFDELEAFVQRWVAHRLATEAKCPELVVEK
jgi:hypothetical protein